MKNLTWQNPEQLFVAQELINKVKSKCCGIKDILKFVAKSELIKDNDRPEYAAIVRSTLSQYELVWLFYNGLSCYGNEKFKPLIEDFSLLKNLRSELLADGKKAPKLEEYASKAYE